MTGVCVYKVRGPATREPATEHVNIYKKKGKNKGRSLNGYFHEKYYSCKTMRTSSQTEVCNSLGCLYILLCLYPVFEDPPIKF